MESNIIISERPRPIWQIPIAALFFTMAFGVIFYKFFIWMTTNTPLDIRILDLNGAIYLSAIGASFCSRKRIHVDISNSRFRPTIEIGPLKFGKWQIIKNYDYVSVFHQPLRNGAYVFEVNLWYDTNKHFELYEEYNYEEAFLIGFDLSEELNIDLLDATVPNDFKWVDKDEWKAKMNVDTSN
jgi:hypothetical protein